MNKEQEKEYKKRISKNIDDSIDSILDFKFPYLTHIHSDEQLFRLKYFTEHLRDKCDSYLNLIDLGVAPKE